MVINFVGNFQTGPGGEIADEVHIARSMEELGHTVRKIPRDEWREYVIEGFPKGKYPNIPEEFTADINIIAKWHHFYDGRFIDALRDISIAPVFYWCWDSVDLGIEWHQRMARAADLYLSGELGRVEYFTTYNIRYYYFQFDCVDDVGALPTANKFDYDVIYLGSCDNQNGRIDLLQEINKEIPIDVFSPNEKEFAARGFRAHPAVYGLEANRVMAKTKIVLGTSCDPHLAGYWSNRVGRTLYNKSFLLQQYAPGMENFLHDWADYYSTAEEAIEKIKRHLERGSFHDKKEYDRHMWTSFFKVKDLMIMIERYLKEDNGKLWQLP